MASRALALATLALLTATALSGCLTSPSPVYVPAGALADGWTHETNNESQSAAGGNVEIVINHYAYDDGLVAEVFLVGITDAPFVDEVDHLDNQINAQVDSADVDIQEASRTTINLDNGQSADVTEYDVTKQDATGETRGKAWKVTWDTGEFIAGGFGYATTERSSLLGSNQDDTQWLNVQSMMRAAEW